MESIGNGRSWVVKQSNEETRSRLSLCCHSCLVWCAVVVIAVRTHMVIGDIGEFLHCLVQFLLRPEFIEAGAFVLQGVEVPLHWRIVVWVPCFAHALGYMDGFTELCESLRCVLAPLVAVQDQAVLCRTLRIQCLLQAIQSLIFKTPLPE